MAKTETLHIRIDPEVKSKVEAILNRLGMSTTEAVTIFLYQVILQGGLPFSVKLPLANDEKKVKPVVDDPKSNITA